MSDRELAGRGGDGRSFAGAALDGADFTGVDLRGVDFTSASLRSASFRNARLGVPPHVGVIILGAALALAIGAGVAIGFSLRDTISQLSSDAWDEIAGGGTVVLLLVILVALIAWRGLDVAIRWVAVAYVALFGLNILANLIWDQVEWGAAGRATLLVIFLVLAVASGLLGRVIGGVFGSWAIAVVAVLGGFASGRADGGIGGIVVALCLVYISKRALRGDDRDRTLLDLAHGLVRRWGTRFVNADLTGADFTGAKASQCNLTGATVHDVRWDPAHPPVLDPPTDRTTPG